MHRLELTEVFAAPVERVYGAWIDARQLQLWFTPGDMRVPEATADVRPGGHYRIVMEGSDGQRHIVAGQYREIVPNERLAFTWQWEHGSVVTHVDVTFRAVGAEQTELSLVHTQFDNADQRERHNRGWSSCLASLARYLRTSRSPP